MRRSGEESVGPEYLCSSPSFFSTVSHRFFLSNPGTGALVAGASSDMGRSALDMWPQVVGVPGLALCESLHDSLILVILASSNCAVRENRCGNYGALSQVAFLGCANGWSGLQLTSQFSPSRVLYGFLRSYSDLFFHCSHHDVQYSAHAPQLD